MAALEVVSLWNFSLRVPKSALRPEERGRVRKGALCGSAFPLALARLEISGTVHPAP